MRKKNQRGDELLGLYDMAFKQEAEKGTGEAVRILKSSLRERIGKDRGVLLVYKEACRIISPQDSLAIIFSAISIIVSFLTLFRDMLMQDRVGNLLFLIPFFAGVAGIIAVLVYCFIHPGHPFEYGVILRLLEEIEKEDF